MLRPHQQPASRLLSRRTLLARTAALTAGSLVQRALAGPLPPISETLLTLPDGKLRGDLLPGGIRVYRGIPFAAPPTGTLRFRPPTPAKPWPGVRDATRFAPEAMQPAEAGIDRSEDCLYLNVWSPAGPGPFPVFVWIHGGGYTGGRSFAPIFDGTAFAQAGIVTVTVAYRLGVFGFMDLSPILGPDYSDSANNGTRDLVAALAWVQLNIAACNGDPTRVTVSGESAGAKASAALMAIPEAQPLFHSVISESGGGERVLNPAQATAVSHAFAEEWQRTAATRSPGENDLRTAAAAALIDIQQNLIDTSSIHFPFRAQIGSPGPNALLPKRPVDLVAQGSARGKRLLLGSNRDESALFLGPHPALDPAARDLGNLSLDRFDQVFPRYAALYPEMSPSQRRIRAVTAEEYWVPTVRLADAHVRAGGGPTWMYRLDFTPPTGRFTGEAYHSEDLGFVWDHLNPDLAAVPPVAALARQMHTAWAGFIRGDTPAAPGLPAWPAYRSATRPTLILDLTSRVEQQPAEAELRLWDGVL